jgi:cytidylate kinase
MNNATTPGRLIVTIDGPAGTGKTTVAQKLAARLGLDSLDTGAMYRAVALITIEEGIDLGDASAVVRAVARHTLDFDWDKTPPELLLDGRAIDARLREGDVNELVSRIANIGELRSELVKAQRAIADQHPRLVTEGRDQGSVVFPDAEARFYLDAAPRVRAERRAAQLRRQDQPVDEEAILHSIETRDHRDETRSDGPLRVPEGAVRIDTSELSLEGVVDKLESIIRSHRKDSKAGSPT